MSHPDPTHDHENEYPEDTQASAGAASAAVKLTLPDNPSVPATSIAQALAAAHNEMPLPSLDSNNPHFNSAFLSLAGLLSVKPILSRHGLSLFWEVGGDLGSCAVQAVLLHTSGERLASGWASCTVDPGPQKYKAAHTYLRRITGESVLGLCGATDDDGNLAQADEPKSWKDVLGDDEMEPFMAAVRNDDSHKILDMWESWSDHERKACWARLAEFVPGKVMKIRESIRLNLDAARDERKNEVHAKMEHGHGE